MTPIQRMRLRGNGHRLFALRPFTYTSSLLQMSARGNNPGAQLSTKQKPQKRSRSPSQSSKTSHPQDSVYVLTLLTSHDHHQRMTALRNKYFPAKLNKLAAHLTLFHALPGTKLDTSIIPLVKRVAKETVAFNVRATQPFRLKQGIAIAIPEGEGGEDAQSVHNALQRPWLDEGFLSQQDSERQLRLHYTLMNKVDDEAVIDRAMEEVTAHFSGDTGKAEGLALYRYEGGWWKHHNTFRFRLTEKKVDAEGGDNVASQKENPFH